jgi:hypothetical protein
MLDPKAKAKLAFVIPFTGKWPKWCSLFFSSVKANPVIDVILLCEHIPPCPIPSNAQVHQFTRQEITARLRIATGLNLLKVSGHKLCDFKPFYGLAFQDLLEAYEFWGFCDIDLMFGSLEKLLTPEFYDGVDVFSAHDSEVVGHFTIIRNNDRMNRLAFDMQGWERACLLNEGGMVDEVLFTAALKQAKDIRWRRTLPIAEELRRSFCRLGITFGFRGEVVWIEDRGPSLVTVENGQVLYKNAYTTVEVMYVHFMGLKRWWHWIYYSSRNRKHNFSRVGYGGVGSISDLLSFPWVLVWRSQSVMLVCKAKSGGVLRRLTPQPFFLYLRRIVFGSGRY